jgi:hypothetical protein
MYGVVALSTQNITKPVIRPRQKVINNDRQPTPRRNTFHAIIAVLAR